MMEGSDNQGSDNSGCTVLPLVQIITSNSANELPLPPHV